MEETLESLVESLMEKSMDHSDHTVLDIQKSEEDKYQEGDTPESSVD